MKAAQVDAVERTTALLTRFSLSTAAPELGQRLESAGHREALLLVLEVLEMEAEAREQRKITRLRRAAQLPPGKTFETLDASTLPAPLMRKLRELARGEFLERAENALAFGLPGVGKSHAACAIGNALIEQGHSVLFRPAYQLVQELLVAKRDLVLPQKLRRLDSFELLILDDIGYVKQNPEEAEVLFTLIAERYERRSMLITSNLVFSDWERIFKDPMATAAAIDRLVHHAAILEFNVPSYRTRRRRRTDASETAENGARGRADTARRDGDARAPQRVPTITVAPMKELNKEGLGQTSTWRRPAKITVADRQK
jgi:DNA replication protein DnaC